MSVENAENQRELEEQWVKADRKICFDMDVRGAIALLALIGVFLLAGFNLWAKGTLEIPSWAAGMASSVMIFYFATRPNSNGNPK